MLKTISTKDNINIQKKVSKKRLYTRIINKKDCKYNRFSYKWKLYYKKYTWKVYIKVIS